MLPCCPPFQAGTQPLAPPLSGSRTGVRRQHASLCKNSSRLRTLEAKAAVAAPPPVATKKASFSSFDSMIEASTQPVLVDFMATWCGPCQLMSNVLRELGHDCPEIQIVKIDIDKYPQLATKFRIQGLPTLVLFRDGKPVDRIEGLTDSRTLGRRVRFMAAGLETKFGRR